MGCFRRCWSFRHQAITVPSLFAVYRWWPSQENVRLREGKAVRAVTLNTVTTQGSGCRRDALCTPATPLADWHAGSLAGNTEQCGLYPPFPPFLLLPVYPL